jgi:probable HAF family extracellular repeat protein
MMGVGFFSDGSVIVGLHSELVTELAVRWVDGVIESLGDLPGGSFYPSSRARDVSADGRVVVGRGQSEIGYEAFRWEDGVMVGLGDLSGGHPYPDSEALSVSEDGSVIVGVGDSDSGDAAFLWTAEMGMTDLKNLLEIDYELAAGARRGLSARASPQTRSAPAFAQGASLLN